ncbi:MAG: M24 family metallopeptidase [archaeon]|nr:M24 family metallopeptidase [archaeon]
MTTKLEAIERGCKLNDQIFLLVVAKFKAKEFKTEKDVANFIDKEIKKAGAKNAFPTIVASGSNAVDWHHKPTPKKLRKDFCVIDFGSKFNQYCSDMTRTVFLGKASKTEKRIYNIVKRTQEKCIKKIKEGTSTTVLYLLAKKSLGAYADYFGHGLGHGLSKKIHDKPGIGKKESKLKAGQIITIEPGIYIPRLLGIRIEDDVLVKKNGYKVLSKSTKKLIEIPEKV